MTITDTQAEALVEHTLGGSPVGRTATAIANDAGELLLTARDWRWADGSMATLDFTADQNYVALPADFHSLISIDHATGTLGWFSLTTHGEISRMRSLTTSSGPPYHGVIVHDQAGDGTPGARIALYPTPGVDLSPALQVWYRRGWAPFPDTADGTEAKIPVWLELLYIELLKAVARGHEDDVGGPSMTSRYVAEVMAGPVWKAAKDRDIGMQPSFGRPQNGLLDSSYPMDLKPEFTDHEP